jgi:transposase InsO family protein
MPAWMMQMARNVTMEEWGLLSPGQYLIHDRDTKFCPAFQQLIDDAGVERVVLPPRSPNLNAYAERWVRSVKEECLSRVILFGEAALCHALNEYLASRKNTRSSRPGGCPSRRRVAGRDCSRQAPSERHVQVSLHAAQALRTSRCGRGFTTVNPWLWTWA